MNVAMRFGWTFLSFAAVAVSAAVGGERSWSFDYAGQAEAFVCGPSRILSEDSHRVRSEELWRSPDGRLALRVTRTAYKNFPVREYLPEFVALGDEPTEIVSNFKSIDVRFDGEVDVRALTGTWNSKEDFTPRPKHIGSGQGKNVLKHFCMATGEGKSSGCWMPFWGVDRKDGTGCEYAIGWSGPWRGDFSLAASNQVRMTAGMLETHFRLLPHETLRMPSMLIFERQKGVSAARMQTLIHRFMLDEKSPRDAEGRLFDSVLALGSGGGNKTPEMMKRMIAWKVREKMPFNCFWVDAGWNGPAHQPDVISNCGSHWWRYAGDWRMNPTVHPEGNLASVADAAHAAGMKMLLWFEPERCMLDSIDNAVLREHRDWLLPAAGQPAPKDGIYCHNLGHPEACDYLIELLSKHIRESHLDIYRQDFNFNAIPHWRSADAPDRKGVTEAKYIAGLYRLWDTLRQRFPNLLVENCASGGRRLDFEAISRSHSYCRTDYAIDFHGDVVQVTDAQNCTYNILAYQPFQGGESRAACLFDDYGFFSTVASGSVFTPSDWHGDRLPRGVRKGALVNHDFTAEENDWLREVHEVADRMRPFFLGDFYPLCGAPREQTERQWCAWQLHRPDLAAGFAIVFRRIGVDYRRFTCRLNAIDPKAAYDVAFFRGETRRMAGRDLAQLVVDIRTPRDFKLFFYTRVN